MIKKKCFLSLLIESAKASKYYFKAYFHFYHEMVAVNQLFSFNDCFMDSIPALSVQTPIVGGIFVTIDSDFSSLYLFVCINAHDKYVFIVFIYLIFNFLFNAICD
mgnify:CR=1 FL=1